MSLAGARGGLGVRAEWQCAVAAQVFELAFEGISRSSRHKSTIALRLPRIERWRTAKPASQADGLAQVHALLPGAVPGESLGLC